MQDDYLQSFGVWLKHTYFMRLIDLPTSEYDAYYAEYEESLISDDIAEEHAELNFN